MHRYLKKSYKRRYTMKKNEIVLFNTEDNEVKLEVPVNGETVWLSRQQMAELLAEMSKQ